MAVAANPGPVETRTRRPVRVRPVRRGLYTADERRRRDASRWTTVQAILAPLQLFICIASTILVVRYLETGDGLALANASVVIKTMALYAIMVTGSIWERDVFGQWLFAPAFFWEDVVSIGVIALHTIYLVALIADWLTPADRLTVALLAYGAYVINATQFLVKLHLARRGSVVESAG